MHAFLFVAILSGLAATVPGHQRGSKLALTIVEPAGHRPSFRSVAVPAPHGLMIRYHYECRSAPARMSVIIVP